jgi:cell division cycle protein 20 (cofactor of APC complex)
MEHGSPAVLTNDVVYVWHFLNMGPTRFVQRLAEHSAAVRALAWCPSTSSRLASGGGTADPCIKIWNTENGSCVKTIKTGSQVTRLAIFLPFNMRLAIFLLHVSAVWRFIMYIDAL